MDREAKIIPINTKKENRQEENKSIIDNLFNTLSEIDEVLDDHLNNKGSNSSKD